MDDPLDWLSWFAVALPVSGISIMLIWLMLLVSYKPTKTIDGEDLVIKEIRPTHEKFTLKQYWVTFVCIVTIGLWCVEKQIEPYVGDMGIIAIIPIVAFFSTSVLRKVRVLIRPLITERRIIAYPARLRCTGRLRAVPVDNCVPRYGGYCSREGRHVVRTHGLIAGRHSEHAARTQPLYSGHDPYRSRIGKSNYAFFDVDDDQPAMISVSGCIDIH